ncbi:hypothetical protein BBJ28_00011526 [Nothophytophthora sp. Chile5]|nr:hypothetical protein BBJ28_00011526 [Nothophytophthora sp. Chile5]
MTCPSLIRNSDISNVNFDVNVPEEQATKMAKTAGDGGGSTARAAEDRDKGRTQENDGVADSVPPLPLSIGERSGAGEDRDLRREVGKLVVDTQQTIDSHLTLFRVGCILTVVGSLAAAIRLSGLVRVYVEEIPLWHFARRKKLLVRMIRQSQQDPSVFYVYHTPFLRRTILQDVLPKSSLAGQGTNANELLAVRPFGVQVDESAQEWVWANFVSSNRYLTIQLLQRCVTR